MQQSPTGFPTELLYIFIAHCILLRDLSVRERARRLEELSPELLRILVDDFLPIIMLAAAGHLASVASAIPFDIDGRVFCSLTRFLIVHHAEPVPTLIGHSAYATLTELWLQIGQPPINLSAFASRFPADSSELSFASTSPKAKRFQLLPFDNEIFNAELSLVRVAIADGDPTASQLEFGGRGTIFSDTQHWHNQKTLLPSYLGGSDPKPLDERARRRALRNDQRFMATMQTQAATLVGASGGALKPIIIPVVGMSKSLQKNRPTAPVIKVNDHCFCANSSNANVNKQPTKKEKTKLSSADKLRQKIKDEKTSTQDGASQSWWQEQLDAMSKLTNTQKISQMNALFRNKKGQEKAMGAEMRLYRLHLEISLWLDEAEPDSPPVHDKYTVAIMRMVKDICDRRYMTPTISKALKSVLLSLGFGDYSAGLLDSCETSPDKPLKFKFRKLIKSSTNMPSHEVLCITEHPAIWQLRLFGQYMDRSMDSAPDPRVQFEPDAWQREVLDCIDNDYSLLVVGEC
jgi:hypothetical protein